MFHESQTWNVMVSEKMCEKNIVKKCLKKIQWKNNQVVWFKTNFWLTNSRLCYSPQTFEHNALYKD